MVAETLQWDEDAFAEALPFLDPEDDSVDVSMTPSGLDPSKMIDTAWEARQRALAERDAARAAGGAS